MMTRCTVLLMTALLAGCARPAANGPKPAVSIKLVLSQTKGHVVLSNGAAQSFMLYRSALSLIASGKTEHIPQFPKPLLPDKPIELEPGHSVTWQLIVKGNSLYPYTVDRGGIRLLEQEHKVRAAYDHSTLDRIESNEVTYRTK